MLLWSFLRIAFYIPPLWGQKGVMGAHPGKSSEAAEWKKSRGSSQSPSVQATLNLRKKRNTTVLQYRVPGHGELPSHSSHLVLSGPCERRVCLPHLCPPPRVPIAGVTLCSLNKSSPLCL